MLRGLGDLSAGTGACLVSGKVEGTVCLLYLSPNLSLTLEVLFTESHKSQFENHSREGSGKPLRAFCFLFFFNIYLSALGLVAACGT